MWFNCQVHKVKFAIRREANADTRMQAIEETMPPGTGLTLQKPHPLELLSKTSLEKKNGTSNLFAEFAVTG